MKGGCMRFILMFFMLISLALVPLTADASSGQGRAHVPVIPEPEKLISTIDELAAKFNPEVCSECHEDIYEQWQHSPKAHSFSTERLLQTWRTFIKQGLDRETKKDWSGESVNRMSIKSHCLWCHEPRIKYATDELVAEIIDLIIAAVDDPDQAKKDSAVKELSKLNLNCYGCHNMFAQDGGYWGHKPEIDAIYGPTGEVDQENHQENVEGINKTLKSDYLSSVKMCARCHHGCPDSVPFWQCKTLYTSYVENYALKGGDKRCQDCHMKKDEDTEEASHLFPGVHDKEFFGDALDIQIKGEVTHFINNYKNELTPTLCLDVIITSNSGHGLPNG
jgi:cytochrome c553